mmetsp:Transcript_63813/g.120885  ORF Transcript_63813/g.120885 Transcript_63813/m.120885 type:complete len:758 (+) Transcript_63813:147-2420(+)
MAGPESMRGQPAEASWWQVSPRHHEAHSSPRLPTQNGQHSLPSDASWWQMKQGAREAQVVQPLPQHQGPSGWQVPIGRVPSGQFGPPAGTSRRQLSPQHHEAKSFPLQQPRSPGQQARSPGQQTRSPGRQPAGQLEQHVSPRQQLSPRQQEKQQPRMSALQGEARPNLPPQPNKAPPQTRGSLNKSQPMMRIRLEDVEIDKTAKLLGKGTFGVVYKARLRSDHRKVAVKIMEKMKLQQLKVPKEDVLREVEMMRECAGDNCNVKDRFVQIFDFIQASNKYYLIMEFCDGNLQDAAMSSKAGLGEQHVRMLIKQMLESIVFLHSKDICHRDVKPHNFLVCGNINSTLVKIKLGDFGEAIRLKKGKLLKNQVGTPAFMAPEMHLLPTKSSGYDHKVDVWALGICMVFLLASEYPFIDGSGRLLRHKLIQGDLPLWDANTFEGLFNGFQEAVGIRRRKPSGVAIRLTRRLLTPRRQDRPSASEAMKHDWFHKPITDDGAGDDTVPLLDMKDFQIGFASMEHDLPSVPNPSGKVKLGITSQILHANPSDARSPSCPVCHNSAAMGYACPHCYQKPLNPPGMKPVTSFGQSPSGMEAWSTVASSGDLPQQWKVKRSMSEQARPRTFSGELDFGRAFSSPYTPEARRSRTLSSDFDEVHNLGVAYTPEPVPRQMSSHEEAFAHARRSECCFVCKSPSSMLDHVCPLCNASVCAGCIRKHLERDPHCPCCNDRDRNVENLQMILGAHKAKDAWQSFWGAITGTV